jgi:hypothetical protein
LINRGYSKSAIKGSSFPRYVPIISMSKNKQQGITWIKQDGDVVLHSFMRKEGREVRNVEDA